MNGHEIRFINGQEFYIDLKTRKIDRFATWINNDERAMILMFILAVIGSSIAI